MLFSHEQLLRAEEKAVEVFRKRRCIYSGTEHEREVNSCWIRSGVFLVAVTELPEEQFLAAGNSRHFARAYRGECVRVCTLLSGVHGGMIRMLRTTPNGIPTRVRKTKVRTAPVRSRQCERVNSANETRVRMSNVRMSAMRMRQRCERRLSELSETVYSLDDKVQVTVCS